MDRMVNYIQLSCMLRTYITYNSTMGFSKYEFYNKLLGDVTLLRITSGVTWTQLIFIYIYIYMGWVQVTSCVTLSNITLINLFLIVSEFW